jgi:hypothetical protein
MKDGVHDMEELEQHYDCFIVRKIWRRRKDNMYDPFRLWAGPSRGADRTYFMDTVSPFGTLQWLMTDPIQFHTYKDSIDALIRRKEWITKSLIKRNSKQWP